MKYTYTILRYIHDVMVGEFVNVGIILHCQEHNYIFAKFCHKTTRISRFFPGFNKRQYMQIISHIENEISIKKELKSYDHIVVDARTIADSILPIDDSSLQFTEVKGGTTNCFEITFSRLYDRFIGK